MNFDPEEEEVLDRLAEREQRRTAYMGAVTQGVKMNPDEYAKAVKLSLKTGVQPPAVLRDMQAFEQEAQVRALSTLQDTHPKTAAFLEQNAEIAHDDMDVLTGIESAALRANRYFKGLGESVLGSWIHGSSRVGKGLTTDMQRLLSKMGSAYDVVLPKGVRDRVNAQRAADEKERIKFDEKWFNTSSEMGGRLVDPEHWIANSIAGTAPDITVSWATAALGPSLETVSHAPVATNLVQRLGQYLTSRAPQIAMQTATSFPSVLTSEADEYQQNNKDAGRVEAVGRAAVSSLVQSMLEGLVEVPFIERMQKSQGVIKRIAGILTSSQIEGAEEVAQRLVSQVLLPDPSGKRTLTLDEIWQNYRGGVAAGAFFGAGSIVSPHITEDQRFFQALHEGATNSKLLKRMPEKFQEAIKEITKDGPLEQIGIPVEAWVTHFQSKGIDPVAKAQEVGISPEEFGRVQDLGGDLTIPTDVYGAKIAGTEDHPALAEDIRYREGMATKREAAENSKDFEERVNAILEQYQETPFVPAETIKAQMIEAGRPEAEATEAATMYQNFVTTLAARLDETPEAIAARYPLQVVLGEPLMTQSMVDSEEDGLPLMNPELVQPFELFQSAYHGSPYRFDKFSLDHMGKGEGAQAYGWGLYFAGSKGVAEWYRENLTATDITVDGQKYYLANIRDSVRQLLHGENGDLDKAIAVARDNVDHWTNKERSARNAQESQKDLDELEGLKSRDVVRKNKGQTYQVDIPEDGTYLLWDKPLSEQPEAVRKALADIDPDFFSQEGADYDPSEQGQIAYRRIAKPTFSIRNDFGWQPSDAKTYEEALAKVGGRASDVRSVRNWSDKEASLILKDHGVAGIKYLDGSSRAEGEGSYNYVVFDDNAVKILQTYYQRGNRRYATAAAKKSARMRNLARTTRKAMDKAMAEAHMEDRQAFLDSLPPEDRAFWEYDPESYQDNGPRGYLQVGPNHQFNLGLLEGANASTVAHEFGHFYLEVMQDLAGQEGTPEQIKQDFKTIMDYYGENGVLTRESHERFADAHLLYLKEGKAPSEELRPAFQRFSRWLSKIWGTVKAGMVDVKLTDEVKGVFDRIYASETEIQRMREEGYFKPMFTAAQIKKTPEQFQGIVKMSQRVMAEAKERVVSQLMAEMEREKSQERRELYASTLERIKGELKEQPAYVVLHAITAKESGLKLSREALRAMGIQETELGANGIVKVWTAEGGMDADTAATLLVDADGNQYYQTGSELVNALKGLPSLLQTAKNMADEEVRRTFPDTTKDPAALRDMAIKAAEGSHSAEQLLALEIQALRTAEREAKAQKAKTDQKEADRKAAATEAAKLPDMQAIREAAIRMLQGETATRLRPDRYIQARMKASNEAAKAFAKGDYAKALEAKQREALNHFMHLESVKARESVDAFLDWDHKLDSAKTRERIGKAGGSFLWQIDQLRLRFGLSDFPGETMEQNQETLREWVLNNVYAEVDDSLLDPSYAKPFTAMTLGEIRTLEDGMRNIKALADLETKIKVGGSMVDLDDASAELVESITKHNVLKRVPRTSEEPSLKQKTINRLKGFDASMTKMETLVNWMDGGLVNGPAHRFIWNPMVAAQTMRYDMTVAIARPLQEAFEKMPMEQRKNLDTPIQVEGFATPLSRREIITMLFNWGNDVNRTKLVKGYDWSALDVMEAFKHLTVADAQFVQDTWDTIESLWPEMVALEKRFTGVEPKKQEISGFTFEGRDGTLELKGGYFPLVADPNGIKNAKARNKPGEIEKIMPESSARPGTSRSALKERTGANYELLLDFQHILTSHVNNVIMDLSHREAIHGASQITSRPEVKQAIQEAFGPEFYNQIKPWLKTIVGDNSNAAAQGLDAWSRGAMGLKSNVVAAALGFKLSSAIVQFADLSRVVAPGDYRVPVHRFAEAFTQFIANPKQTIAWVREMSGEMQHRPENLDRDIRETLNKMIGKQTVKARYNRAAFKMLAWMDTWISVTTWSGAYKEAMAKHGDSDRAVMEADRTVRLKLMSSNPKDLVGVQRSNEMMKLVTMFLGDASSGYNMMRNAGHKAKGFGGFVTQFTPAAMTIMMGAIIGDWLKGQWPDEDEDGGRKWGRWAISRSLTAPFQTVPGLRDAVRALDSTLQGKPFSDYQFSPAFAAIAKANAAIKSTADLLGEEGKVETVDWAIKAGDAIGTAFGVGGTAQAASTARWLRRVDKGEEEFQASGLLLPQPKKGTR